jgi:hypothetical protein
MPPKPEGVPGKHFEQEQEAQANLPACELVLTGAPERKKAMRHAQPQRDRILQRNQVPDGVLAVYNFFVGDLVILIGVSLTMILLALIAFLGALAALHGASGAILIAGVLLTLLTTLGRKVLRPENKQKAQPLSGENERTR